MPQKKNYSAEKKTALPGQTSDFGGENGVKWMEMGDSFTSFFQVTFDNPNGGRLTPEKVT